VITKTVKIVTFVPRDYAEKVRGALGSAGAGKIGQYSFCSFSVVGEARFLPLAGANPFIGELGNSQVVQEERIEVVCAYSDAKVVISAIKSSHPYNQVGIDIYPLLEEADFNT
jgi:hypothetical protein